VLCCFIYGSSLVREVFKDLLPLFMKDCDFLLNLGALLILEAGDVSFDLKLDLNKGTLLDGVHIDLELHDT